MELKVAPTIGIDFETQEIDVKAKALANYLKEDYNNISKRDENTYELGSAEYLVLTDIDADEICKEYILETLWAFNAEFIASHARRPLGLAAIEALGKTKGELCEDANDLVFSIIKDIDHFIEDAISADGRGHFLSQYDGHELELGNHLYAYRVN